MHVWNPLRRSRAIAVSLGSVAALAAAAGVSPSVGASVTNAAHPHFDKHAIVVSGLDNPRQLSLTTNGSLLVAEAGHGSYNPDNCAGHGENATCAGKSGKVAVIRHGAAHKVMAGLLSGAAKDGSFAVGSDGASKRLGGGYYSIITYAPPDEIPQGLPGRQAGRLLMKRPNGHLRAVANISKYEIRHDVDGEGVDTNPYSVLALKGQVLVTDAAADYIARVKGGKVSVWTVLPEYGNKVDAVPTVVTRGHDGKIYVGELHSEIPHQAKVWKYNRHGVPLRSWGGFTTVTGVARGADGSLYVSELFGGKCGFDQIPKCFPGRVVRVSPNGDRTYRKVPFPAGIAVTHGKVYVAAFSTSPSTGFGGNPDWSGQIWRVFAR